MLANVWAVKKFFHAEVVKQMISESDYGNAHEYSYADYDCYQQCVIDHENDVVNGFGLMN